MGEPEEPGLTADVASEAPLDLCIVGAGIAGTVAALRARELGLRFRVFEKERPLHRQPPSEAIDRAATVVVQDASPSGSPLIADAALAVASPAGIADWIARLSEGASPPEAGVEVVGIELEAPPSGDAGTTRPARPGDHVFCLRFVERAAGREGRVRARHVVLATGSRAHGDGDGRVAGFAGRGFPRAVAEPALIVGDGQRAIESLIALAEAKAAAGDPNPVYWSPAVRKPEGTAAEAGVSRGTGDRLLDALRRGLEIRTLAPLTGLHEQEGEDGAVRVVAGLAAAVRTADDPLSPCLDFDPTCVWRFDADAEEDDANTHAGEGEGPRQRSWPLLSGLPVRFDPVDDTALPLVGPTGESSLAGLYLVGDLHGEVRLVCDDFEAEPDAAACTREARDASIEWAATEAVTAVEAIAGSARATATRPGVAVEPGSAADPGWRLVAIQPDGSLGAATPISLEVFEIGRRGRHLAEPEDTHMADHHASLVREDGEYYVADSGRGSGVWIRIHEGEGRWLEDEDQIWLGSQILVASHKGEAWTLVHYGEDGLPRETHRVTRSELVVGRDADVSLVVDDTLLSRRHARFRLEGERLEVFDCGARNGTFVKVKGAHPLVDGSEFRVSTRGYRFEVVR